MVTVYVVVSGQPYLSELKLEAVTITSSLFCTNTGIFRQPGDLSNLCSNFRVSKKRNAHKTRHYTHTHTHTVQSPWRRTCCHWGGGAKRRRRKVFQPIRRLALQIGLGPTPKALLDSTELKKRNLAKRLSPFITRGAFRRLPLSSYLAAIARRYAWLSTDNTNRITLFLFVADNCFIVCKQPLVPQSFVVFICYSFL